MKRKLLSMGIFLVLIAMLTGCSVAGNYYRDGKKSFVSGDYDNAAKNFTAAITANPNRADYYIDYGMTLISLGKYRDAITQFNLVFMDKDILVIRQNNKRILRGRGIAYYHMLMYEKAIEEFEHALEISELSSLNVDILYYMGNSLKMVGAYEKAIEAYTIILSGDKDQVDAYNERAYCYKLIGEYEKSLLDYDSAISLDSKNYDYYFGKYLLMAEQGDTAGALAVLSQAEEIVVKTPEDKYNLAKLHFYQENYELALSELSEGYAGGFTEAYYYIGETYRIGKDYAKAIYYYEVFIKDSKVTVPAVYNQLATCLIKTDDCDKALDYLEEGISLGYAGTMQILKRNEIIAYENLGMFEEAKGKLKQYLSDYPEDSQALREEEFIETRLIDVLAENKIE
jgi:tetratricopeptide (TPR) repeat protein